jgi:hypothetical protein
MERVAKSQRLPSGDRNVGVGLAGLVLFGFGLLVSLTPLLFLPDISGSLSLGLLGEGFAVPYVVALAVWPFGLLSVVGGWTVMVGSNRKIGVACAAAWALLGLLATLGGAAPGLFLAFTVVTLFLWRRRSADDVR